MIIWWIMYVIYNMMMDGCEVAWSILMMWESVYQCLQCFLYFFVMKIKSYACMDERERTARAQYIRRRHMEEKERGSKSWLRWPIIRHKINTMIWRTTRMKILYVQYYYLIIDLATIVHNSQQNNQQKRNLQ